MGDVLDVTNQYICCSEFNERKELKLYEKEQKDKAVNLRMWSAGNLVYDHRVSGDKSHVFRRRWGQYEF